MHYWSAALNVAVTCRNIPDFTQNAQNGVLSAIAPLTTVDSM